MDFKTVIICLILSSASSLEEFIDEFSRNVLDDDLEYVENEKGFEHFIRKIRSVEEDYRNVQSIDSKNYCPEDLEMGRTKREVTKKRADKVEELGNPLEVVVLNVGLNETDEDVKNVTINNFIRFRRDADLKENDKQRPKRGKYNNSREEVIFKDVKQVKDEERPPNVHFITQRRSESSPPRVYRHYDDFYPRYRRRYERYPRRYEPDTYYPQNYEPPRYTKQRRIIYYATLPEDVRSPRDRYDHGEPPYLSGRYVPSERGDPYGYRRSYLHPKSRYDERVKTSYPFKVSADVTVREIKKNPERRIYSEVEGGYEHPSTYRGPYGF